MSEPKFSIAVAGLHARVSALQDRMAEGLPVEPEVREAMDALSEALEELAVAEEELNVQAAELVLTRAAAEASERRYRELFDAAPDAYVLTDRRATILEANRRMGELLGIRPDHLVGKPLAAYVALNSRRPFRRLIDALQGTLAPYTWEGMFQPRAGEPVPVEVAVDPGDEHAAAGWRWLIRDSTERKQLERAAVEAADRERRRLGQELHDDLGQRLVGIRLLADALGLDLSNEGSPHAARVDRIARLAGETLAGTRALAHGLAAVSVPPEALASALTEMAQGVEAATGVACCVEVERPEEVDDAVTATHLFRIAQEAVANAVRHAAPHRVTVHLHIGPRVGLLAVSDDGHGFTEAAVAHSEGLGLRSMRMRAGYIGATLDVHDRPGGGTVVECRFPVQMG